MSLIANERTKLTANLLNTVAGACLVAGAVTPLVMLLYGFASPSRGPLAVVLIMLAWIVAGAALHLLARQILGRLRP